MTNKDPLPVSELVERLRSTVGYSPYIGYALVAEAADRLTALEAENAKLREALFVADDTIMSLNGCFPMDRDTPELDRLHRAAKLIRSFTSDDYLERKRVSEAALTAPQGGDHGE